MITLPFSFLSARDNNLISSFLLLGGRFTYKYTDKTNKIVRLNSDSSFDSSFNMGSGFDDSVETILVQSDGKLIFGGLFTTYKDMLRNRLVRLLSNGEVDDSFNLGTGFNNPVLTSLIQSDGKIIVGGIFTNYNGTTRNRIARLNTDGTYDTSFNIGTGFNSVVRTVSLQTDGNVVVGGQFTSYQGTSGTNRTRLVRLLTNASFDTTFSTGAGFNSTVFTTSIQSDGKVIVGGQFTLYQGTTRNRIVRLLTNGNFDTTFDIGTGFNSIVYTTSIQSDGKVIVGGQFTQYQGTTRNRIARLNTDGSYDTSFNIGGGFNSISLISSIQTDGKVVVGGQFTTYQSVSVVNRIIRLNTDGSIDTTFKLSFGHITGQNNESAGFNNTVRSLLIQSDSKVVVGGDFDYLVGDSRNRLLPILVRENFINNIDNTINNGEYEAFDIQNGFNNTILKLLKQPDGKVVVGGFFTEFQGTTRNRILRLNTDGSYDTSFDIGTGFNNAVSAFNIQSDGKLIMGGSFTSYKGTSINRIIRLESNGTYDSTFNVGTGFNAAPETIEFQSDGKVIIGGIFTTYQGTTRNRIVRLLTNGTFDTTFNISTGFNSAVRTSLIQSDGKVIVGGQFTQYQGSTSNRIIRLNTDGSNDVTFDIGEGFDNEVRIIRKDSKGRLILGGDFNRYYVLNILRAVQLDTDGSIDTSFNIGTGFNSIVYTSVLQSDGKVIVGGQFTLYQGTTRNRIARLNTDASIDTTFNGVDAGFNGAPLGTSVIQSDGKIVLGGGFTSYNGVTRNRIARLNTDGTYDTSFDIGTGFNQTPEAIALQSDGKIIVGGQFTSYQGTSRNRIARLNTDGSYDTSFDIGTGFNNRVIGITIDSSGKIYVGGEFTVYNGTTSNRIIRLNTDASIDTSFDIANGFNGGVTNISFYDGKLIVSGGFISYNGITANQIIKLNTDGSRDFSFDAGSGFSDGTDGGTYIFRTLIESTGKIIVVGSFLKFQGINNSRITRLNTDGSLDTSFDSGAGFNNDVWTGLIRPNDKTFFGGAFTSYYFPLLPSLNIIRLVDNGEYDTSFRTVLNGFNSSVQDIIELPNNNIIVGGFFNSYANRTTNSVLILNEDSSINEDYYNDGKGVNSAVFAMLLQDTIKQKISNQKVVSFSLINSSNNTEIMTLSDNVGIPFSQIDGISLNFRANTSPTTVGSVFFSLSGPINLSRIDNGVTYDLLDSGGVLLPIGNYILSAIPYSGSNRTGNVGKTTTIRFSIVAELITNGLVLLIDPSDTNSYPGTGTDVFDLSGFDNDGILVNGTGFSDEYGGEFVFDGINNYIEIPKTASLDFTPTDSFTMNVWANGISTSGEYDNARIATVLGRGATSGSFGIGFGRASGGDIYSWRAGSRAVADIGVAMLNPFGIECITFVYTPTFQYTYRNGVLVSAQDTSGGVTGSFQDTFYAMGIDRAVPSGGSGFFNGIIYHASIYNRAFTDTEVSINYNALLPRFSIN
jgi:uncharacterized delta-60 repeat protein